MEAVGQKALNRSSKQKMMKDVNWLKTVKQLKNGVMSTKFIILTLMGNEIGQGVMKPSEPKSEKTD